MRLSSYLQDGSLFTFFWKEAVMDVISEILDMIGDLVELIVTGLITRRKRMKQNNKNERGKEKQCTTK